MKTYALTMALILAVLSLVVFKIANATDAKREPSHRERWLECCLYGAEACWLLDADGGTGFGGKCPAPRWGLVLLVAPSRLTDSGWVILDAKSREDCERWGKSQGGPGRLWACVPVSEIHHAAPSSPEGEKP